MAGMRDMMIHDYFSISPEIVLDVVQNKIPTLRQQVEQLLKELGSPSVGASFVYAKVIHQSSIFLPQH